MTVVLVYNSIQTMTAAIIPKIMMVQKYSIQHELGALNVSSIIGLDKKLTRFDSHNISVFHMRNE